MWQAQQDPRLLWESHTCAKIMYVIPIERSTATHFIRYQRPSLIVCHREKHVNFQYVRLERLGGAEYQWSDAVEDLWDQDSPVEWRWRRRRGVGDRVLVEATEKGDGAPQEDEAAQDTGMGHKAETDSVPSIATVAS
jgi:hypothetical protein